MLARRVASSRRRGTRGRDPASRNASPTLDGGEREVRQEWARSETAVRHARGGLQRALTRADSPLRRGGGSPTRPAVPRRVSAPRASFWHGLNPAGRDERGQEAPYFALALPLVPDLRLRWSSGPRGRRARAFLFVRPRGPLSLAQEHRAATVRDPAFLAAASALAGSYEGLRVCSLKHSH